MLYVVSNSKACLLRSFFPGWKNQLLGGIGLRCEGQGLKEMYEASILHRGWWVPGNPLPGKVVEADMVVSFKGRLDKYMNRMGIEGYSSRKGRGF